MPLWAYVALWACVVAATLFAVFVWREVEVMRQTRNVFIEHEEE